MRGVNDLILDYYTELDDEVLVQQTVQERIQPAEDTIEEPAREVDHEIEQNDDVFITKTKSAMKRPLNLYDIKLKPTGDDFNPREDDQVNNSREKNVKFSVNIYKKVRLKSIQL